MIRVSNSFVKAPEGMVFSATFPVPVSGDGKSMHTMLKRHEIQILRRTGLSLVEITHLAGVSERTIQRIIAEPPVVPDTVPGYRAARIPCQVNLLFLTTAELTIPWHGSAGRAIAARWRDSFDSTCGRIT